MKDQVRIEFTHYRMPLIAWDAIGRPRKNAPPDSYLLRYSRKNRTFHPAPVGGATEARIRDFSLPGYRQPIHRGRAVCSFSDGFCYQDGRAIALERLLESINARLDELEGKPSSMLRQDEVNLASYREVVMQELAALDG